MEAVLRMRRDRKSKFDLRLLELQQLIETPGTTRTALELAKGRLKARWDVLELVYTEAHELYRAAAADPNVMERWAEMTAERDDAQEFLTATNAIADAAIASIVERTRVAAAAAAAARENRTPTGPPPQQPAPSPPAPVPPRPKLPQLSLRSFSHNPQEWTTFWDIFHANVDGRQDLDPVTKFSHLLNCLEGEAAQLVRGFPLTAASYAEAVELLKDEYGQNDVIIQSHVNALYKMQSRKVTTELSTLKKFFVDINTHVRSLRALGKNLDDLGALVKTLLLDKMPSDMQLLWCRRPKEERQDVADLMKFVHSEIEARELRNHLRMDLSEDSGRGDKQHDSSQRSSPHDRRPQGRRDGRGTTHSLPINASGGHPAAAQTRGGGTGQPAGSSRWKDCLLCGKDGHRSARCPLTLAERRAALRTAGRCFVCLQKGHRANECQPTHRCVRCHGAHHVYICDSPTSRYADAQQPAQQPAGQSAPPPAQPPPASSSPAITPQRGTMMRPPAQGGQEHQSSHTVATHSSSSDDISLKTSMITLFGPHGATKRVRCLLDTASHRTYITTEVAEFLGLAATGAEKLNISGYGGGYTASHMKRFTVGVGRQDSDRPECQLDGLATSKICEPLPRPAFEEWIDRIDQSSTPLADDPRELRGDVWTGKIDLLIGADQYWLVLTGDSLRLSPKLMLLDSIFGWFLHGVTGQLDPGDHTTMALLIHANPIEQEKPTDLLARLFDLDGAADGPSDTKQLEMDPAVQQFNSSITKIGQRYQVGLTWKEEHKPLPANKKAATAQLNNQLRRLNRQPELLAQYHQQIMET